MLIPSSSQFFYATALKVAPQLELPPPKEAPLENVEAIDPDVSDALKATEPAVSAAGGGGNNADCCIG